MSENTITQEMADQAEQAYELLAEALSIPQDELIGLQLIDLATSVASQLRVEFKTRTHVQEAFGNFLNQIARVLDISPGASPAEALAEIENLSRLADRAIQIGARDAINGPYVVITTIQSGEITDIATARERAELIAKRSSEGMAAIAQIIASVELTPKWSDAR